MTLHLDECHIEAIRKSNVCAVETWNGWNPPFGERAIGKYQGAELPLRVFGNQEMPETDKHKRIIILVPALDPIGE